MSPHLLAAIAARHPTGTAGLPLVVATRTTDDGTVLDVDHRARVRGVQPGWSVAEARAHCVALHVATANPLHTGRVIRAIEQALLTELPSIRQIGNGHWSVRIVARDVHALHEQAFAIQSAVHDATAYDCVLGAAPSPVYALIAARVAADADPRARLIVGQEGLEMFLDSVPLRFVPGMTPKLATQFAAHGLYSIAALATADGAVVRNLAGMDGEMLWHRARGTDAYVEQRVRPAWEH